MKEWEQILIAALICLALSAILIVVAAMTSIFEGYGLSLQIPPDGFSTAVIWELLTGIFGLVLGVGLLVCIIPVYRLEEKSLLSPHP